MIELTRLLIVLLLQMSILREQIAEMENQVLELPTYQHRIASQNDMIFDLQAKVMELQGTPRE